MEMEDRVKRFPVGAAIQLDKLGRDPYASYAKLHECEPISWIPALNMWYVVKFADVQKILFDTEHFCTGTDHSTLFDTFGAHMLTVDGPDHDRWKAAARKPFMPKTIRETMQGHIEHFVDGLIDGFVDAGTCEFRKSFANRLPVQTILALFGLPLEEEQHLRRWYDSFEAALANFTWDQRVRDEAHANVEAFHALLQDYMNKFRETPNTSLLSALVNADIEDRLSDDEIKHNASIIFFGGISTVEALTLNSLLALLTHEDVLARVKADDTILPQVIDEVLRWRSPVQSATRHVVKDFEFNGVMFRAGETVNCMLGAANRDPAIFAAPELFDIDRANAKSHIGFAVGPHHCLGSHLAKAEALTAIKRILTRLPNLRFKAGEAPVAEGFEFHQPRAMHLVWG